MKQNPMILRYSAPAPIKDDFLDSSTYENSWERFSLPLGNGFFGANLFLPKRLATAFSVLTSSAGLKRREYRSVILRSQIRTMRQKKCRAASPVHQA